MHDEKNHLNCDGLLTRATLFESKNTLTMDSIKKFHAADPRLTGPSAASDRNLKQFEQIISFCCHLNTTLEQLIVFYLLLYVDVDLLSY